MPLSGSLSTKLLASLLASSAFSVIVYFIARRRRRKVTCYDPDQSEVVIVEDEHQCAEAIERLNKDLGTYRILGLDCEWVTPKGRRKPNPVALLQLASSSGLCVLIRLCKFHNLQSRCKELERLLSDRSILKVGVAILEDAKKLNRDHCLLTRGCLDLRYLALRHLPRAVRAQSGSLRELASLTLNFELGKSMKVRCGNWEASELNPTQIHYAAQDASVAVKIFFKLLQEKLEPRNGEVEGHVWRRFMSSCQGLTDVKFKGKFSDNPPQNTSKGHKNATKLDTPREKSLTRAFVARKQPLYDNCKLISPNGQMLTTCDRRKAEWYVNKGIGEFVGDDPITVRLLFEPAGVPGPDQEYYMQDKQNICVVCGRDDSYIRKNIIPHEYRKYFPDRLKMYSSHDVLLLCLDCHQRTWIYDTAVRQRLAEKYNAPLDVQSNSSTVEDGTKSKVRSAGKALFRNLSQHNLPANRIQVLEQCLKDYYGVDEIREDLIVKAQEIETKVANNYFRMCHGQKVVEAVKKEGSGVWEFQKMWREHFVRTMDPQFLPKFWSVDHKHEVAITEENKNGRDHIIKDTGVAQDT